MQSDLPLVRDLYVKHAKSYVQIEAATGISRNSIPRWRKADEAAGNPNWDDLRGENERISPYQELDILRWRMGELLRTRGRDTNDKAVTSECTQLRAMIREYEVELKDPGRVLDGLLAVAKFMRASNAPDDECAVFLKWTFNTRDAMKAGKFDWGDEA